MLKLSLVNVMAYGRGDSMISDFMGRGSLPVRDFVVSIEGGPKL